MENSTRIQALNERLDKLIYLNQRFNYTSMVLVNGRLAENPKSAQYTRLLLDIHKEKVGLWVFNRDNNKVYHQNLENAKIAIENILTKETLFGITNPKELLTEAINV